MKRVKQVALSVVILLFGAVIADATTGWTVLTYLPNVLREQFHPVTVGYDGGSGAAVPVTPGNPLPVTGTVTTTGLNTLVGAVNETAPGTDTASSGLNGRLQRVAQRLTSLIALLPTSLDGGSLKVREQGTVTVDGVPAACTSHDTGFEQAASGSTTFKITLGSDAKYVKLHNLSTTASVGYRYTIGASEAAFIPPSGMETLYTSPVIRSFYIDLSTPGPAAATYLSWDACIG